jgi:hypothetical protein
MLERPGRLSISTLAICTLALSACVNTQVVSSWRNPDVSQVTFTKVLAVAMIRSEGRRRAIEDRMVADIEKAGAAATPSYQLITNADVRSATVLKAAVQTGGFDGAITWRTISVRNESHFVPGNGFPGFWGYWDFGWASVYDPGYLQTDRIVQVETLVYQVTPSSDRLIWAGTSETIDPGSLDNLVDSVSSASTRAMRDAGLFSRR